VEHINVHCNNNQDYADCEEECADGGATCYGRRVFFHSGVGRASKLLFLFEKADPGRMLIFAGWLHSRRASGREEAKVRLKLAKM
jgi:hypothetical protein